MPLEVLHLPRKTENFLKAINIHTVEDLLVALENQHIMSSYGIGPDAFYQIRERITKLDTLYWKHL